MNGDSVLPNEVLTPLCEPFSTQADWLLDLHELTQKPNRKAGKCLKCFYALLEGADSTKKPALEPLKKWIEQNVEITIKTNDTVADSMPVQLVESDFDGFCQFTIDRLINDRVFHHPYVELELQYKSTDRAA